jgi:cysteine desulfuration protein SufE
MTPEEIVEDFQFVSDWEDRFRYLLDLADELPEMDAADKTDENRLFGCQSRVWIKSELCPTDPPVLYFQGDSDSQLVKGLVAIAIHVSNHRTPKQTLAFDLHGFFKQLGLEKHLTRTRATGLAAMAKRIKQIALDCETMRAEEHTA